MPSLLGLSRSVPPTPPSSRPRPPSSASSLPPPRSSRPSYDPWALANKTLELKHANTYIAELQELVAFRDARIAELEDNLAKARRRLEDLERRLFDLSSRELDIEVTPASVPGVAAPISSKPATLPAVSPGVSPAPALQSDEREVPLVTETRPALVLPLPSAEARGMTSSARAEDDGDGLEELASDPDPSPGDGVLLARGGSEDNLQQISGIGPRFEAALRKQGITRLSQIAAWSEADVRQVAKALKIPKSRIVKGRWVEVAREVIGTRAASE
jgi:predicted flap endonuclease-1-like 5' DNA nuclease